MSLELLLGKNFYRSELSYIKSSTFSTSSTSHLIIYVHVGRQKDLNYKGRECRKKMPEENTSSGSDGIPRAISVKKGIHFSEIFFERFVKIPHTMGTKEIFGIRYYVYTGWPASCNTIVYR